MGLIRFQRHYCHGQAPSRPVALCSQFDRYKSAAGSKPLLSMPMSDWSDETHDPLYADDRNFYKVELWTKDRTKVDRMLFAGSDLDKAREVFAAATSAAVAGA